MALWNTEHFSLENVSMMVLSMFFPHCGTIPSTIMGFWYILTFDHHSILCLRCLIFAFEHVFLRTSRHFYRVQTKFVKVMFLHVSVILSTVGRYPSMPCSRSPACTEADTPPWMATAAAGTHPTGMHSCCLCLYTLCTRCFYRKYNQCLCFCASDALINIS